MAITGNDVKDLMIRSWEDTKEFKDARNPLHWGHNIGAVGARGIEAMVPTSPKELMQELAELKAAPPPSNTVAGEASGLLPI